VLTPAQLAPVSAFDQVGASPLRAPRRVLTRATQWLDEEPKMNRLDDSMKLFDWLCANPMLANATIILFLSARSPRRLPVRALTPARARADKIDVLAKKLAAGVPVAK
jgi:hypothetical protein